MIRVEINWKMPLDGSIIDFETTHFDVTKGELITTGFLTRDGFVILQRLEDTEAEFKKATIKEMKNTERPRYAFNKKFEESFCGLKLDRDLQINQEFSYESAYGALKNENLLNHYNLLCDPLFNEEISSFWEAWKITGNLLFISKIVRHNYCCLAKEYYLKLKRIDGWHPNRISPFLSSAPIEKKYIRPSLKFSVTE